MKEKKFTNGKNFFSLSSYVLIIQRALAAFSQCGIFLGFHAGGSLVSHEGQANVLSRMSGSW